MKEEVFIMPAKKQVIVTGGSRGIGKAIAAELLRRGFAVTIVSKNAEEGEGAAKELSMSGRVAFERLDLTDRNTIKKFTDSWQDSLYGIVNNAGMWGDERIDEPDTGLHDRIMRLNVDGLLFFTKGLLPHLTDNGRIVNISSQLGLWGREAMGSYSASKHAVIGFTKSWAYELGPRGITVNAVCPGWVDTESNFVELREIAKSRGITLDKLVAEISAPYALKRFVTPQEVANVVAFLLSEDASGVTGGCIGVI